MVSLSEVEIPLSHLNLTEPSIQCFFEHEERCLPFIDLNVHRKLQTRVYRKTTHTNEYLAFHFHHPMCHKKSITRTLLTGAEHLPSSYDSKEKEHQYVFSVLKDDDYPKTFLCNCCKPDTSLHDISMKEVLMAGLWLSCTFVAVQNP